MKAPFFIGVDIGSQGIRVVMIDSSGEVPAHAEEAIPLTKESRQQQSPEVWWTLCLKCLKQLTGEVKSFISPEDIKGIAVTSTSGTVIPLDQENNPLHDAIMYSDGRSVLEAKRCRQTAETHSPEGYTGFNTSSGLSKMVWFTENFPEQNQKLARWVHAADFITGNLSGVWGMSDYTNALKSGYDVEKQTWPSWLFDHLPLKREWMPEVVASGHVIGSIRSDLAEDLGLSKTISVAAGMTDGCASQIASGAINPGDWNTTIGTTLVIKGVTRKRIIDPQGRLYSHRHPMGYWMPGGASNTGADWITAEFGDRLEVLNQKAMELLPTPYISYPLRQPGERFPFIAPEAEGFEPDGLTPEERFTANMEGVAYLERYAFELISQLSGENVKAVYSAGGGSRSEAWLKIRSNVLNCPVYKMKHISGAVGAAILAASQTYFDSITAAVEALTQIEKKIVPDDALAQKYEANYQNFLNKLIEKEYIEGGVNA